MPGSRSSSSVPAYCFLIALNPDGTTQLCYPESPTTAPPATATAIDYPPDPRSGFGLTDGVGTQVFVVVASAKPLPSYAEWSKSTGDLALEAGRDRRPSGDYDGHQLRARHVRARRHPPPGRSAAAAGSDLPRPPGRSRRRGDPGGGLPRQAAAGRRRKLQRVPIQPGGSPCRAARTTLCRSILLILVPVHRRSRPDRNHRPANPPLRDCAS